MVIIKNCLCIYIKISQQLFYTVSIKTVYSYFKQLVLKTAYIYINDKLIKQQYKQLKFKMCQRYFSLKQIQWSQTNTYSDFKLQTSE